MLGWRLNFYNDSAPREPSPPPKNCIELPCISCLKKVRFYDVEKVSPIEQFCNRLCEWDFVGRMQFGHRRRRF